MRRFFLFIVCFLLLMCSAIADEYVDVRPGFVSSLSPEGVGLYASPSLKNNEPLCQIGHGVSMYLNQLLDTDWASVRLTAGAASVEGYVRTGSLVMNDYGLGVDTVRLVSDDLNAPVPFYQEPSEQSKIHGQYYTGTLFPCTENEGMGFHGCPWQKGGLHCNEISVSLR